MALVSPASRREIRSVAATFVNLIRMAHSENVVRALTCAWVVAAAVLAWRGRRGAGAFRGSAVAAIPAVGYSMLGYGLLPMAGVLHVLSAGFLGLVLYGIRDRLWPRNRAGLTSRATAF